MSWEKVKLGKFLKNREGRYKPNDKAIQGLKRIDKINFSGTIFLSDKPSSTDMILVKKGDLVISGINVEKGAMNIYKGDEDVVATIHYSSYEFDNKQIDIDFLTNFLKSLEFKKALKEQVPGGMKTEIKPKHILPLLVDIPTDIKEQKKVVKRLTENNNIIGKNAAELTHQLDLIKQLRQSFLREAMQGKLVTTVRSSAVETQQTGQQLLAKIKAEKAQLIAEKKLKQGLASSQSINLVDDYPNPINWTWCKADEIFFVTKLAGFEYSKNIKLMPSGEIPVIRAQNVRPLKIKKTNLLYIDRETSLLLDRCALTKKCLLVTFIGAGIGDVSTFDENERWHLAPNVAKMEPFVGCENLLNVKFVNYYLMSNIGQSELFKHVKATAQPSLSMGTLRDIDIPLPPLHEQEQIVTKLEELMAFCDGLEQSIKESQGYNEMLLQQVLREALQPKEETKIITITTRKLPNPLKTILAAHIINICNTRDFGRVKFQKLLFLVEYFCEIDFESKYVKKAAGPYDYQLIKQIEQDFNKMNFFKIEQDKSDNHRVTYTPRSASPEINGFFLENFADESLKINAFLMKMRPLSWSECEIVATIFAVWNNRLIKKELVTDELLYNDFMAWSSRKSNLAKDFYKKLFWMKEEQIVPKGWGNYVDEPSL